jgi:uncharacterized Zn finger protein (UPF0148 family)
MMYPGLSCSQCGSPLTLGRGTLDCHGCDTTYSLVAQVNTPTRRNVGEVPVHSEQAPNEADAQKPNTDRTWCEEFRQAIIGGMALNYLR